MVVKIFKSVGESSKLESFVNELDSRHVYDRIKLAIADSHVQNVMDRWPVGLL